MVRARTRHTAAREEKMGLSNLLTSKTQTLEFLSSRCARHRSQNTQKEPRDRTPIIECGVR